MATSFFTSRLQEVVQTDEGEKTEATSSESAKNLSLIEVAYESCQGRCRHELNYFSRDKPAFLLLSAIVTRIGTHAEYARLNLYQSFTEGNHEYQSHQK